MFFEELHDQAWRVGRQDVAASQVMWNLRSRSHFRLPSGLFNTPALLHWGRPIDVPAVMRMLGPLGWHGALDPVEGAVWRVERQKRLKGNSWWVVDFLAKHVRKDKCDGCYLREISGKPAVWNTTVGWDGIVSCQLAT